MFRNLVMLGIEGLWLGNGNTFFTSHECDQQPDVATGATHEEEGGQEITGG